MEQQKGRCHIMPMKPILFNTEMARALLDGKKTMTRRIIKPQPEAMLCYAFGGSRCIPGTWGYPTSTAWQTWGEEYKHPDEVKEPDRRWTPPCHAEDILWVRETWYYEGHMHDLTDGEPDLPSGRYKDRYIYKADSPDYPVNTGSGADGWRPSIHMPREAARIFLKVSGVQIQRLQNMTEYDAYAEGCRNELDNGDIGLFRKVWDSTIKDSERRLYGWEANPYVWVIDFRRVDEKDDASAGA